MSLDVEPQNLRGQDQSDVHLLRVDEAEADAAKYLGVWVGKSNLMKRGLCPMGLQIEGSHDPNHPFTGFSKLACAPTMFEILGKAQHDKTAPGTIDKISKNFKSVSTILIGTLKNGAVTFEPQQARPDRANENRRKG